MTSEKPFGLSIKVVLRDADGRCLLLKRSSTSKNNAGKWDFPGGKIDAGEAFDEALLREVAEETGLKIRLQRVAGSAESESPDRRVAYLIMEGLLEGGKVELSEEHDGYKWVHLEELPKMNLAEQFRPFVDTYVQSNLR